MKQILVLFAFILSLTAAAQEDSVLSTPVQVRDYAKDTMHLTMRVWQYAVIAELEPNKSTKDAEAYRRRVAKRWITGDSTRNVKIVTSYGQFVRTYANQLSKPDGIVADFNDQLLLTIQSDVARHPWVMAEIGKLKAFYAQGFEEVKAAGMRLIRDTKQTMDED